MSMKIELRYLRTIKMYWYYFKTQNEKESSTRRRRTVKELNSRTGVLDEKSIEGVTMALKVVSKIVDMSRDILSGVAAARSHFPCTYFSCHVIFTFVFLHYSSCLTNACGLNVWKSLHKNMHVKRVQCKHVFVWIRDCLLECLICYSVCCRSKCDLSPVLARDWPVLNLIIFHRIAVGTFPENDP